MTKRQYRDRVTSIRATLATLLKDLDSDLADFDNEADEESELKEEYEAAYAELETADTHLDEVESILT